MTHTDNYIEVTQEVPINFDQETKIRWLRLSNKAITGYETVALYQSVSEYHKSVHWYVNCCRRITVKFRLYDDGSLEVLPEHNFHKASHEASNDQPPSTNQAT